MAMMNFEIKMDPGAIKVLDASIEKLFRTRLAVSRGRFLDQLAYECGLKRRKWWIFKEWDRFLRRRIVAAHKRSAKGVG